MQAHLLVIAGADQGRSFPLEDGQSVVIGRGESTTTQLRDPHVSRTHCQVQVDGGTYQVIDAGGKGGTFVNGKQIQKHDLSPGDVIRVGNTEFRFQLEAAGEQSTMVGPSPIARPAVKSPPLKDLVGQTLAHFELKRVLATGSSGMVFLARDTEKNRQAAVKVLFPDLATDEEAMQRFVRAMKTMLPVKHENIVELFAAGKNGPHAWYAMEYVEGEPLTETIERIGTAGMLDWRHAFRVAVHIGRALQAAFEHQIIHRNITPQNILVRNSDKCTKLGDLMLAKALEGSQSRQVTQPGQLVGDLSYMSPERTRTGSTIDCRSDIYSLGATVYALLTGRPPFEGESLPTLITRIRDEEPQKPKKFQLAIPDLLEGVVLKMLAKRPQDRHQTPEQLVADLDRVGKYQGITA
jgi:serine/threonine protein kinase